MHVKHNVTFIIYPTDVCQMSRK